MCTREELEKERDAFIILKELMDGKHYLGAVFNLPIKWLV